MARRGVLALRSFFLVLCVLVFYFLPSPDSSLFQRPFSVAAIKVTSILSRGLPRLLICIAAHRVTGKTSAGFLNTVLDNFSINYRPSFDVRIHVDTNSAELRDELRTRPSPPEVRVWSIAELGGNPYNLPYVHREIMKNAMSAGEVDFVLFAEDDMLVPIAAFNLYVARRLELQTMGWSYGFVRAEKWAVDNTTAISVDNIDPIIDAVVHETVTGGRYAEPWTPYAAFYVLDAAELAAMILDPSDVWFGGFPPFLHRERISVGYAFKKTGGKGAPYGATGWRSRALIPLTIEGRVHPDVIVWHLPSKYAKSATLGFGNAGAVKVADIFKWSSWPKSTIPLTLLPP